MTFMTIYGNIRLDWIMQGVPQSKEVVVKIMLIDNITLLHSALLNVINRCCTFMPWFVLLYGEGVNLQVTSIK